MPDIEIPENLSSVVDRALELVEKQVRDPHVFDTNTQAALDEITALCARIKIESAYCSLRGERNKGTFYNKHCEALEYMINSLKYKIRVITGQSY